MSTFLIVVGVYSLRVTAPQNPWSQQQSQPAGNQELPPQQQFGRPKAPGTVTFATLIGIVVPILSSMLTGISFVVVALQVIRYLDSWQGPLIFNVFNTLGNFALTALWVIFAFRMRAGRNWARTTLAILAGIWLLYGLFGISQMLIIVDFQLGSLIDQPGALIASVELLMVLVAIPVFLVLVFLKPSNQYFKAASSYRPEQPGGPGARP
ncbi:hypothetical protein [Saccharopolyspora shandongensis]|uniref:hypothetical protein n=1 Tax=Saccharopolyspora shandongensis TaxID=418495 RepID=UPI00340BC9A0